MKGVRSTDARLKFLVLCLFALTRQQHANLTFHQRHTACLSSPQPNSFLFNMFTTMQLALMISMMTSTGAFLQPGSVHFSIKHTPCFNRLHGTTSLDVKMNKAEEPTVSRSKILHHFLATSVLLTTSLVEKAQAYPQPNNSYEGRSIYLTEPTAEFLENEKKADIFRREQLVLKQEFKRVLDDFTSTSYSGGKEDEETTKKLIAQLESMISLIKSQQGLPSGIQKEAVFKLVRAKKKEGIWPTSCEYTYVI